jgi:hypothetical protein
MPPVSPDDWQILQTVALASLLAWASGLRLYLVVFAIGLAGRLGFIPLPPGLLVLQHNWVLGAAGFMLVIEFITDKVPYVDTAWDAVHTFIRIPAGALLAAGATGDTLTALTVAAGLLGGTITAGTHFTKAGGRGLINASPEPVTNWTASFAEDLGVVVGTWTALYHPVVFLVAFLVMLALIAWLLPKFWRGLTLVWKTFEREAKPAPKGAPPGGKPQAAAPPAAPPPQGPRTGD